MACCYASSRVNNGECGARVHTLATNRDVADAVIRVANKLQSVLDYTADNGDFLGTWHRPQHRNRRTPASRRPTRVFDQVAKTRKKSDLGGRDAHNRWHKETGEHTAGEVGQLPAHIRGKGKTGAGRTGPARFLSRDP